MFGFDDLAEALMTISTVGTIAGAGLGAAGAYRESQAAIDAANFNAGLYEQNAAAAEQRADDAILRGQEAERRQRRLTRAFIGSQRAAMAANNVRLDEGSPVDVVATTAMLGELDALTIRENARREALGHRQEGSNYRAQASLGRAQADNQSPFLSAAPSLISGATMLADRWYRTRTGA